MAPSGKWIPGLAPQQPVSDAARWSLAERLGRVEKALHDARKELHKAEPVHQVRVSARRAAAALKLYRDFLPRKDARWLKRRLRDLRRAAGVARDIDVLEQRLRDARLGPELKQRLHQQRRAAELPLRQAVEKLTAGHKLMDHSAALLDGVRWPHRDEPDFATWSVGQCGPLFEALVAALPSRPDDLAALHRFRVAAKRARYAVELLAPGVGPVLRREVYPLLSQLQTRLGDIQDRVTCCHRFAELLADVNRPDQLQHLSQLTAEQSNQLRADLSSFWRWWTPRAPRLRKVVQSLREA